MNRPPIPPPLRAALLPLTLGLVLVACDAGSSASPSAETEANIEPIAAEAAVAAIREMEGDFSCAEPIPRADDYAWVCEGSRAALTATIRVYATDVDGSVFGATLYTAAPAGEDEAAAAVATEALARDLVAATVPGEWQAAASDWISERVPDGGRTLDVPGIGITASVQPLAALQWYVELYELDGLEG